MTPFSALDLNELLDSADPNLTLLQVLHGAVSDATVVNAGLYTDEELAAIGAEVDPERSPWLADLNADEASIAVREAARNLAAEELATFTVDDEPADMEPALAALLWSRSNFDMIVISDVMVDDAPISRCVLYRMSPAVFLMEVVGPLGYHELSFCSRAAAAEWLASHAVDDDPGETERMEESFTNESAKAFIKNLEQTSRRHTSVLARESYEAETDIYREVAIFDHADGNWLCEYMDADDGITKVRIRALDHGPLTRYLGNFLTSVHDGSGSENS